MLQTIAWLLLYRFCFLRHVILLTAITLRWVMRMPLFLMAILAKCNPVAVSFSIYSPIDSCHRKTQQRKLESERATHEGPGVVGNFSDESSPLVLLLFTLNGPDRWWLEALSVWRFS